MQCFSKPCCLKPKWGRIWSRGRPSCHDPIPISVLSVRMAVINYSKSFNNFFHDCRMGPQIFGFLPLRHLTATLYMAGEYLAVFTSGTLEVEYLQYSPTPAHLEVKSSAVLVWLLFSILWLPFNLQRPKKRVKY